jgi:hypothetical protein
MKPDQASFKTTVLASLFFTLIVLLALPYPFNCLSNWLASCCPCACPWWLFVLLQFSLSLVWYRYLNLEEEKDKLSRAIIFSIIGLFVFLVQIFSTKYYLGQSAWLEPGLCSRFWIADLLTTFLFILI